MAGKGSAQYNKGQPLFSRSDTRPFNQGLRSLLQQEQAVAPQVLAAGPNGHAMVNNRQEPSAPAPVPMPVKTLPGLSGLLVDPYAAIRTLELMSRPPIFRSNRRNNVFTNIGRSLYTANWEALKPSGFQSKYNKVKDLGGGLFLVTLQQPGAHKYDTMEALYRLDPATGRYQLQNDPMQARSRQISSGEQFRDTIEELLPYAAAICTLGYAAPYLVGASAGAGTATGVAAGTTATSGLQGYLTTVFGSELAGTMATNALIQGGLGGISAEMQGGDFMQGFRRGALTGAFTAGLPSLSQAASDAVGGGTFGTVVGHAVTSGGNAALATAVQGGDGEAILESLGIGALNGGVTAALPSLSQAASDAVGGGTFGTVVGHAVTSGGNAALATAVQGGDGEAILESLGIGALNGGVTAIKESLDSGALGGGTSAGGSALNGQPELPAPTSLLLPDMAPGADNEAVINQLADQGLGELVPYPAHHNTDLSIQNGMMATKGIGNLFGHEQAPPNGGGGREQESPNSSTMLGEGGERSLSAIDPITGSGLIHSRQEDSRFIPHEDMYTQWPESISRIDITGRRVSEDSVPIAPNTDWLGQQSSRHRGGWPNSERPGTAWEASKLHQGLVFNSRSAKGAWGIGISLPTPPASRSWGPLAAETALGSAGASFSPMEVRAGSWLQNISELAIA